MQSSLFEKAVALRADNQPVVRIVEMLSGADWLLTPAGIEGLGLAAAGGGRGRQ